MSQIDPRADAPLVDGSDLGVSGLLPTGTVTLLLADVEGSTRLWETQPEQMTAAIARLNRVVCEVIAAHDGVRPVEQGEGLAWFDAALTDDNAQHPGVGAAVRARALAYKAMLDAFLGMDSIGQAQQALAIVRELDEPVLLARALTAYGFIAGESYDVEVARACFAEAIGLARALDDRWRLSQILALQALSARAAGDPIAVRAAAEEGRDLADAIGDRLGSRQCRFCLGVAQAIEGDLAGAAAQFAELVAEAKAAHDGIIEANSLAMQGNALACQGDTGAARAAADAAIQAAAEVGGNFAALGHAALATAGLAAGDAATAQGALEAWPHLNALPQTATAQRVHGAEPRWRAGICSQPAAAPTKPSPWRPAFT